ncbi:MAG: hypothetical protein ACYDA0_12700 [Candidatus Dormibacteraceae bacterium]
MTSRRGTEFSMVISLSAELIDGLYTLAVSKPIYTELYASWAEMRALLKFLAERKLSGSVMIRAAAGMGVIILAGGELAGAYISESRDIADQPDRALALCEDPNAMIEVKSADTTKHPPLDVDQMVAAQRTDGRSNYAQRRPPTPYMLLTLLHRARYQLKHARDAFGARAAGH